MMDEKWKETDASTYRICVEAAAVAMATACRQQLSCHRPRSPRVPIQRRWWKPPPILSHRIGPEHRRRNLKRLPSISERILSSGTPGLVTLAHQLVFFCFVYLTRKGSCYRLNWRNRVGRKWKIQSSRCGPDVSFCFRDESGYLFLLVSFAWWQRKWILPLPISLLLLPLLLPLFLPLFLLPFLLPALLEYLMSFLLLRHRLHFFLIFNYCTRWGPLPIDFRPKQVINP